MPQFSSEFSDLNRIKRKKTQCQFLFNMPKVTLLNKNKELQRNGMNSNEKLSFSQVDEMASWN